MYADATGDWWGVCGGGGASSGSGSGDLSEPSFNPLEGIPEDLLAEPNNGDYKGNASEGEASKFLANEGGGGGGPSGSGMGAYPGGAAAANGDGSGRGAYKTDIEKGFSNGSGGGYGVGGGAFGGGGGAGPGGGSAGEAGIDLSKYLPGGEMDPAKRDPASLAQANGVTAAEGMSNFEKITKVMNKKKPLLKPGS
jgi:hypothetical protein